MADNRFDGGAAAHLAFDLWCDAALLLGGVDLELVLGRRIVAAVAGVGMQPLDGVADNLLDRRNDARQRVAVIGIARQRLCVDSKLAAFATFERRGDAHLDAELIRLVRLAFADAFDLGRVQAVDFGAALAALLRVHAAGERQQTGEFRLQPGLSAILRSDVADGAAEKSFKLAQGSLARPNWRA